MASAAVASDPTPAGPRLRLSVPVVSHTPIDLSEFNALLAGQQLTGSYGPTTVLDVRSSDSFHGGEIKGSVHVEFESLENDIEPVLSKLQSNGVHKLIVLDLGSRQQAGIVAELIVAKLRASSGGGEDSQTDPVVYVLTCGFSGVLNECVNISPDRSSITLKDGADKLIANFDASRWTAVSVPRTPSNADQQSSVNMLVYKSAADSAHVFVEAK